jgi:CBS domain-containing protein
MSARAAARLEAFGFRNVLRYTAGKADWFVADQPRAGTRAHTPRAGDVARRDVPTCELSDTIGHIRGSVRDAGWNQCVVVDDQRVVLGRLRWTALEGDPDATAEQSMQRAPLTIRTNTLIRSVVEHLRHGRTNDILVTTSDGVLVGVVLLHDAELSIRNKGHSG